MVLPSAPGSQEGRDSSLVSHQSKARAAGTEKCLGAQGEPGMTQKWESEDNWQGTFCNLASRSQWLSFLEGRVHYRRLCCRNGYRATRCCCLLCTGNL